MLNFWPSSLFALLFLSPLGICANTLAQSAHFIVGQPVKTTSGTAVGHAAGSRAQVSEYLGIPFAQPPIGKLRFAAPQPYKGNGTIVASKYVSHRYREV
jgi:Carboxylesterase family